MGRDYHPGMSRREANRLRAKGVVVNPVVASRQGSSTAVIYGMDKDGSAATARQDGDNVTATGQHHTKREKKSRRGK